VAAYDDRTALIVVDIQNDFADPAGGLYVLGGEEVVPVVNAETDRALAAGAFVAYTQDWHPPNTPHFAKDGGIWPVHCVAGTWGRSSTRSSGCGAPSSGKERDRRTGTPASACGIPEAAR
jgi:hypothetical protein